MSRKEFFVVTTWLVLTAGIVVAQQQSQGPPPSPKPGPEHAKLKELEGNWDASVTTHMDGKKSQGEASNKMECGGLWLTSDFKCQMEGQPFHGKGFDTYDAAKKKHIGVWVDSMVTVPLIMEGTRDESTKTTTCIGECPGPDGKMMKVKGVTKELSANQHTFEMYMIGADGKETKTMTIEYTRRK